MMLRSLILLFMLAIFSCEDKKKEKVNQHDHSQMNHEMDKNELHLSEQQIQLGNITVDSVKERQLGDEFLITGIVNVNQNTAFAISSRVMGRIEKLYFKNSGEQVSKGALMYEIFSEDLNMAVRELLLATDKFKNLKNEQVNLQKILESVRTKLRLYGLSDNQVTALENERTPPNTIKIYSQGDGIITSVDVKEGDYIMEGASVFHLADLSTVWVEGQVYSDYLKFVNNGISARITFSGYPGVEFKEAITFVNPELNASSKINLVRIEIANKHQQLKPGMQAYINVLSNEVTTLAIPTDAIIRDGKGAAVWIKSGENMFKSKMVTIGLEANGYTEIKSGLKKGEQVVVTGVYLLNSEFIFQNGVNPMEGHDMSKM